MTAQSLILGQVLQLCARISLRYMRSEVAQTMYSDRLSLVFTLKLLLLLLLLD